MIKQTCMILLLSLRWFYQTVSVLDLSTPITVETDITCADATKILSDNGIDQVPVVNSDGLVGHYNTYMYVHIQISIVIGLVRHYNTYTHVNIQVSIIHLFMFIKKGMKSCTFIIINHYNLIIMKWTLFMYMLIIMTLNC